MLSDSYAEVLDRFVSLLSERLGAGIFTTEDSVRYTLFLSLIQHGHLHTDITLEEPLANFSSRQVDMVVQERDKRPTAAFEFKYDRQRLSQQNRPQRAGSAYRDIFRLAQVHAKRSHMAYFIYLTDPGMEAYLRRPKHRLDVFSLEPGTSAAIGMDFIQNRPMSLLKNLHGFQAPCTVTCVRSERLPAEHWLHILSVEHVPDAIYQWD